MKPSWETAGPAIAALQCESSADGKIVIAAGHWGESRVRIELFALREAWRLDVSSYTTRISSRRVTGVGRETFTLQHRKDTLTSRERDALVREIPMLAAAVPGFRRMRTET